MVIDKLLLQKILIKDYPLEVTFNNLGLLIHKLPNMLSYLSDSKYLNLIDSNTSVKGVFTTKKLARYIKNPRVTRLITDDPAFEFFLLHNTLAKSSYRWKKNKISKLAKIEPSVFIGNHNITIGANTVIEPRVTILPDVEIGENCIIRSGSVIGSEGFEYKHTSKGILQVVHDGKAIIGNNVDIGVLNSIAKGFSYRDTRIGNNTKTDNLVHIAHGVHIGESCLIPAGVTIAGSVTVGNNVWIGPGSCISNQIIIGDDAFISLGSVVTKDISESMHVTGNFAIPHAKFISNLKKSLK